MEWNMHMYTVQSTVLYCTVLVGPKNKNLNANNINNVKKNALVYDPKLNVHTKNCITILLLAIVCCADQVNARYDI